MGATLSIGWTLPFLGVLLSIALLPVLAPIFWHHHWKTVAASWAAALALPFVGVHGSPAVSLILHTVLLDYLPFIVLLGCLFTVTGGVVVRGTLRGTPGATSGSCWSGPFWPPCWERQALRCSSFAPCSGPTPGGDAAR